MIRDATQEDIEAIVNMAMIFWHETPYDVEGDEESMRGFAEHCFNEGLLSVLEINGTVEGFAAGIKGFLMGNLNYTAGNEVAWWVNPDHRCGRNGIALLRHIEKKAKEAGMDFWTMAFMTSSMPEKVEQIYKKLGYKRTEVQYTKRL